MTDHGEYEREYLDFLESEHADDDRIRLLSTAMGMAESYMDPVLVERILDAVSKGEVS